MFTGTVGHVYEKQNLSTRCGHCGVLNTMFPQFIIPHEPFTHPPSHTRSVWINGLLRLQRPSVDI